MAALGLGLAALGRPGYLNLGHADDLGDDRSVDALRERAHEVLDAAWQGGIRHFDAARSYGRAEEFLGTWLRSRDPADAVVSSKWGYVYTADWQVDADPPEVKHHDVETLRRQLAETREQLGDRLDLYAIHSATPDTGVLEDAEVLDELRRLRDAGVRVGLTVSGTSQGETIERALELGLFDAVQATWNLFERSAEPALAAAAAAGLTVYVKEALANGRLAGREAAPALADAAAAHQTDTRCPRARRRAVEALGGRRAERSRDRADLGEQPAGRPGDVDAGARRAARRAPRGARGVLGAPFGAAVDLSRQAWSPRASASRLSWSSAQAGQPSRCARMPGDLLVGRAHRRARARRSGRAARSTARRSAPGRRVRGGARRGGRDRWGQVWS